MTLIDYYPGDLVRFFDAFNTQKRFHSLGIVISGKRRKADWGNGWAYRVLLTEGEVMEIFDYEMRLISEGR